MKQTTTRERIRGVLGAYKEQPREHGVLPDAWEIAMELVDEDVSAGEYEGCSPELDLAASEYLAAAQNLFDEDEAA
jgi:hypothetical protein